MKVNPSMPDVPDSTALTGEALPERVTAAVPGPVSRALARRLAGVESRNITRISPESDPTLGPIFWAEARGANVRDADGNIYVDLTAGFGVAAAGHGNTRVAHAIGAQASRLAHGLGDVYPPDVKVPLLERLAALAPGRLGVSILASGGAEAVEAALKTAVLRTGRPGVIAFTGSYHGLTYGTLASTWRPEFRTPFEHQLYGGVRFAPYPHPYRWHEAVAQARGAAVVPRGASAPAQAERATSVAQEPPTPARMVASSLAAVQQLVDDAEGGPAPIGAVLVEPIQGRGGIVVPPEGFLPELCDLCADRGLILIADEVYTGFGRTGHWFACEREGVVPDVLAVGKALSGALPLSAAIGTPDVMEAWPPSAGEAIHTSTFLGNPVACAAGLAHLEEIESRGLVGRAAVLGERLRARLEGWRERYACVGDVRGAGLLQGIELVDGRATRRPAAALAARVVHGALERGVLLLSEGPAANVLAITPPLVITEEQVDHALDVVEDALVRASTT